jgi:hypothetical protein
MARPAAWTGREPATVVVEAKLTRSQERRLREIVAGAEEHKPHRAVTRRARKQRRTPRPASA